MKCFFALCLFLVTALSAAGFAQTSGKSNKSTRGFDLGSHDYHPDMSGIPQPSRYKENPLATKGLYKITANGVYYYRENLPPPNRTVSVRVGTFSPTSLVNPDNSNATYSAIYGTSQSPIILYDYERPFFRSFGRLAWKLGTGLFVAQGHGIFVQQNRDTPPEQFTLIGIPLSAGLVYSLQFSRLQWVVPYAEAGGDFFGLTEIRSDKAAGFSGIAGAPTLHFSFGARVPLGFNVRDFLDLAREYGISVMYLTGEYRDYIGLSNHFDLSGSTVTVGVAADY